MPPARVLLFAATCAVLLLVGQALIGRPPPLWGAALAFVLYSALILTGVFALRLRMFVDAVTRGPHGVRGWALTFDDGPDPATTPRVLDVLDQVGAKATFFVIVRKAEAHPELVREILARGHSVGLHSYAHDRLFALRSAGRVREDLERGIAALAAITGEAPALFRPPIGHTNPTIARVVEDLDLITVGWSVSAHDGTAGANVDRVVARVSARLHDGAIVLMHDASERGTHAPVAADAVARIVEAGREARLEVVPLGAWIGAKGRVGEKGSPIL
jgi:peptidoglycan/xylan/chitin deacetylase (PgdA/CDA1 family)